MKLLIIDDHDIVRQGVRRLLSLLPDSVVAEAGTAEEGFDAYMREKPAVVVLDINLGGGSGLELLTRLRSADQEARVVMFSMHADPAYANRALRSGALGFVGKSASADELIEAVKAASTGRRYIDKRLASDMVLNPVEGDPLSSLSNRETEILRLLGEGKSLNEIAITFGIAYKTVANTCTRLKEKLGVERTADLIRISLERMSPRAPG
ncbi:MAG TPA: response regulator transcription factor [Hyphomicrobium sp.]|jgi:DNA-binding NarL/FixJ family response regulator|nr:response regulator transcription factor [Hyphomicrobium sp.]